MPQKNATKYKGNSKILSTRNADALRDGTGCCRLASLLAAFGSCHTHSSHLSPPTYHLHTKKNKFKYKIEKSKRYEKLRDDCRATGPRPLPWQEYIHLFANQPVNNCQQGVTMPIFNYSIPFPAPTTTTDSLKCSGTIPAYNWFIKALNWFHLRSKSSGQIICLGLFGVAF